MAKDVAQALGYEKPRNAIQKYVEGEDKLTVSNLDEPQNRAPLNDLPENMTLINEPEVYPLDFSDDAVLFTKTHFLLIEIFRRHSDFQRGISQNSGLSLAGAETENLLKRSFFNGNINNTQF